MTWIVAEAAKGIGSCEEAGGAVAQASQQEASLMSLRPQGQLKMRHVYFSQARAWFSRRVFRVQQLGRPHQIAPCHRQGRRRS